MSTAAPATATTYTAAPRSTLGTKAARKLRSAGQIPVTLNRRGQPSQHLTLDTKQANHLAAHVLHLCTITVGGAKVTALKGDVARDCLKDSLQHIDLHEVDASKAIEVDVAVALDARDCPGVKAGGIVEQRLRKVRVRCATTAIPDRILFDLGKTQLAETVPASALPLPAGVALVTNPKALVLSVVVPRAMKVEEVKPADGAAPAAAAAGAAPAAGAAAPAAGAKPDAKGAAAAKPDAKAGAKPAAPAGDAKKK